MAPTELRSLLDSGAAITRVAALLDGLSPADRQAAVFTLDRASQKALWERAADSPPISLDHFVPANVAHGLTVRHQGRNTLPLPRPHRHFEKHFCRPADGTARLFGFNQAPSRAFIGPGYFVAQPTSGRRDWEARGAVVIDYFQVPDGPVPEGWPKVVPNTHGLQFFVYRATRDFMRRVSAHVSIGAAYRRERPLDHWFVLCREP